MNALIRWSIRYRGLVAALSVVWIVAGTILALRAPLDVFPEFVPPQVTIQTESAGLAPEQVEQIVTRPIEAAINGAPGVASMRSESVYGLSVVLVTFEEGVDAVDVRQGISERLATLTGKLPIGVEQPKLTPLTSSTMDVVKIGLVSDTVDPFTLRDVADWTVKQRLLAVPGIARVGVYGGAIRQVQIQPKLDRLTALGLTVSDVMKAGREALTLRGGGFIETAAQRITLETPPPAPDPQAIAQTLVTMQNNMPIKLGDVATVTIGPATPVGEATIMGRPGVLLTVSGQFGSNTLVATKATEEAMAEMTPVLEARGIEVFPTLHRPATFVERALGNLQGALLLGSALILLVLYAFLRSVRAALISFLAIPMSMLAAVVVLSWMGQSVNTMTLGGFALALGVLVDDAIIDIENIMRRLRQARRAGDTDAYAVIESASIEIRGSMLYGTLAVIFVFLPVLFAGGVQGRFIGPMALTFILAVLASMIVALTVTPALCALLLTDKEETEEPRLLARLRAAQAWALEKVRNTWGKTIAALALAAAAAASVVPFLHSELIPQFREGHFVVQMSMAASGTSVGDVMGVGIRITNKLLELPFIDTVGHQIGRAESGEDTWSPDRSEFHIELKPVRTETEEEAEEKIRDALEAFPEIHSETMTFLGDRISETLERRDGSGRDQRARHRPRGHRESRDRDRAGDRLGARPHGSAHPEDGDGADALDPPRSGAPLELRPHRRGRARCRPDRLRRHDHRPDLCRRAHRRHRRHPAPRRAQSPRRARDADGRQRGDARAPAQRGDDQAQPGPLQYPARGRAAPRRRDLQRRRHRGRCRTSSRTCASASRSSALPKDVYLSYAGQAEEERAGQIRLATLTAISTLLITMVLALAFRRRALAALVLINLPFCLIGSMAAIVVSGIGLTLGSLVGLVTVFGIGAT